MGHDQQPEPGGHAGGSGWGAGVPDLVAAIDLIGHGTALAAGASLAALSLADKRELMAAMVRARTVTEAAYLHVLSQFDRTPGVVPGTTRRFGYAFLTQKMNYAAGAAAADVAAARQLDPSGSGYDPGLLAETAPARWTDPADPSDPSGQTDPGDPASHPAGQSDSTDSTGSTGSTGSDGVGRGGVVDPDGVHAVVCDITGIGAGATVGTFGATTATGAPLGLAVEGLPRMGAALAAALVTRAHVDVAVRCLARVPEHLANRVDADGVSGRVKIDVFLTRVSREHSPSTTDRIAKELLAALDPDGQDSFDPLAYKRRTLSLVTDSTGMTSLRGLLDPASAAILRAALAHYRTLTAHHLDDTHSSDSDGGGGGGDPFGNGSGDSGSDSGSGSGASGGGWAVPGQESIPIRDDRSRGMRDVDALTALCEAALRTRYPTMDEGGPGCQPAAPLVKVIITATPEQAAAARRTTPDPLDDDGVPLRPAGWHDPWDPQHLKRHHPPGHHPPGHHPPGHHPPGHGSRVHDQDGSGPGSNDQPGQDPPARPGQDPPGQPPTPPDDPPDGREGPPTGPHRPPAPRGLSGPTGLPGAPGLAHETESGDPITAGTLGRLLCDADLQTVILGPDRAVLDLGRSRRLAIASQRTALVARDRGCVVPGCGMPPSACQAHHVRWWRHGGGTDIANLALVCGRHHTAIHTGEWVLQMIQGVPYVVAPSWIDPTRTPRRNTHFDTETHARHLGQAIARQQRLPFDH